MPNTLTIVFTSIPSNQPVEFQNPNSPGVYVLGTQAVAGGPWQAIFTGVTKGTYGALTARLKNYPAISATIAASSAVLNIVPAAPLGTSASGTSTGISVTASTSPNGLANRILSSATSGGTFAQIYQGAASNYTHLLAGGTVQYYRYQYVGDGGFYDDSLLSGVFQGTASLGVVLTPALSDFSYNVRNSTDTPTHSALSGLFVQVSGAAYVDVEYTNTRAVPAATANGLSDPYGVSVNSLGAFDTVFLASGVGVGLVTRMTFANAAAGLRQFIEGVQEHSSGDTGTFGETHITKLTFPPGSTAAFQKPAANFDRLLVLGDSKSVGVYATNPGRTAWMPLLRGKRPAIDIYSDGYGYRMASVALVDAPTRAVLVTNAVRLGITRYVVALATNDRNAGLDPATVMNLVSLLADQLQAQIPAIIFYVELEYDNSTTANSAWRTAAINSKGARGSWYRLIDPGAPTTADGLHPNDAGQLTVANAYDAQLDLVPAVLANPVLLDAANPANTATQWADSGAGHQNAFLYGSPSLVQSAVFGKAAYYFPDDGVVRYAQIPALASQANAYTIALSLRSISTKASQFVFDCAVGRIVVSINGFDAATIGAGAYYANTQNSQPAGARGTNIAATTDTVIIVALDGTSGVVYVNGTKQGTYAASITQLNSHIRFGSASDQSAAGPGCFFGYLQAAQVAPGKFTDAQALSKYQELSGSAAPPATAPAGTLAYSAPGLVFASDAYTTSGTSGNYDVFAVSSLTFVDGTDSAIALTRQTGDGDLIIGFNTSNAMPTGPGSVQTGVFLAPSNGGVLTAINGAYTVQINTVAVGTQVRIHRSTTRVLTLETSPDGVTWTVGFTYPTSPTGPLTAVLVAKSAATTRLSSPRYVGGA